MKPFFICVLAVAISAQWYPQGGSGSSGRNFGQGGQGGGWPGVSQNPWLGQPGNGDSSEASDFKDVSSEESGAIGLDFGDGQDLLQLATQLYQDYQTFNWTDIRNLLSQVISQIDDAQSQQILTAYLNRWLSINLASFLTNQLSSTDKQNIVALASISNNFTKIQQAQALCSQLSTDTDQMACFVIISEFYGHAFDYLVGVDIFQNYAGGFQPSGQTGGFGGSQSSWGGFSGNNFGSWSTFKLVHKLFRFARP